MPIRQKGVTLIELMIAVAVASVLLSMAIPSFKQTIVGNRLSTINNEFFAALNFTRAEAIRSGHKAAICKSPVATPRTCSTSTTDYWEQGWIAYVDSNNNGSLDSSEILKVWPALPNQYTLRSSAFPHIIWYDPRGATSGNGNFAACHNSDEESAKAAIITPLRPRIATDNSSDTDHIPETDNGNLTSCESP